MTIVKENNGLNLNTILILISIAGAVVGTVFFIAPLKTLPSDMNQMQLNIVNVQKMQAVQTESLKILAEVAKESKETRSDFDKHSSRVEFSLNSLERRVERVENSSSRD
jgi:hypothetical protein